MTESAHLMGIYLDNLHRAILNNYLEIIVLTKKIRADL